MAASHSPDPETGSKHLAVAEQFVSKWRADDTLSSADFVDIYTPDVVWLDHFFQLHLVGTAAVDQLRKRWCGAMDDRSIEVAAIHPTSEGVVLQLINKGVFARDMLPKRKATGKRYSCHACYLLNINGQGLIGRVDEYQTMAFDDGVEIDGYTKRDGGPVVKGSRRVIASFTNG